MYLLDTNVISESRKKTRANPGVRRFFENIRRNAEDVYLSVVTIGELRRGIELIRHRKDYQQARLLENWLEEIVEHYSAYILDFTREEAQVWGMLSVPSPVNTLDKQIAATALTHDLVLVTRNVRDFQGVGPRLLDPFDRPLRAP
uniref:Ribonuclease VapC n=1 Tax=Candidatus Kentrum sp. FM TaxID=2126340 RepID=A0A450SQW3_9GAMM|nr:MAG: hypothetical protein BECKFM1743C_GA0114222_101745 [Candidatus Kentron sp. FM]VFJ57551.1 MAG: hypothetical protein BECKFM1743A_GA0114220_101935 [Candidatus Kentron sp. FM]VFK11100.1 MAG: hypothetical protein BECKFM1743B_GA0114221_101675 [Candidatus Kentron sp. FM]